MFTKGLLDSFVKEVPKKQKVTTLMHAHTPYCTHACSYTSTSAV